MKRFWHAWLAVVAVSTMTTVASAQWNQQPQIGSYQSILSRTGLGQVQGGFDTAGGVAPTPGALPGNLVGNQGSSTRSGAPLAAPSYAPAAPIYGAPGCKDCGNGPSIGAGGFAAGSGTVNAPPAPSYGGPVVSGGTVGTAPLAAFGSGTSQALPAYGNDIFTGTAVPGSVGFVGSATAASNTPVYQPVAAVGPAVGVAAGAIAGAGPRVNRVGSIFGLSLRRNFEDPLRIGAAAGKDILSTDIDQNDLNGVGVSLITRRDNGNGWEFVFWGLDDDARFEHNQLDFISIGGLDQLQFGGQSAFNVFNAGSFLSVTRDSELNNLELNLLRNGGSYQTRHGRQGTFELLGGFRLFQFNESLSIATAGAQAVNAGFPQFAEYALEAENFLVGGQLGARNELCFGKRLRLTSGVNFGLFNNRVDTRQRVFDQDGTLATIAGGQGAGSGFDYSTRQDDVSILGELRLGAAYQLSQRLRANVGYRAIGVSGVALAADQVPLSFEDTGLLKRTRSNSSLLLHGVFFGLEHCF